MQLNSNQSLRDDHSPSDELQTAEIEENIDLKIKEEEKRLTSDIEIEGVDNPDLNTKISSQHVPMEDTQEHSAAGSRKTEKVFFRNSIKKLKKELTVGIDDGSGEQFVEV